MSGTGLKIGIVVARFNLDITSRLLEGARAALYSSEVKEEDVTVTWVPGSFEIPVVARKLAVSGHFDAVICLGAVIRGETDHYQFIATEAARGIADISTSTEVPVIFGVLTTDTLEQAMDRAGGQATDYKDQPRNTDKSTDISEGIGNSGFNAGQAAIQMANLMQLIDQS